MDFKAFLMKQYKELNRKSASKHYKNIMKNNIKKYDGQLEEQSRAEILDIKTFWDKYGYTNPDFNAFRWFSTVSGKRDVKYITEDFYATILMPSYNERKAMALDDKNLYDLYFSDVLMPETLFHNINGVFLDKDYRMLTLDEAVEIVQDVGDKVVIKPSANSCKGQNVKLIPSDRISDYFRNYSKNYIVQKKVEQHAVFESLNESSSNVVRVTSVLTNGRVYLCSPTIRVGETGRFTDQGGAREFCIGIDDSGRFKPTGLATKCSIQAERVMPNGYVFGGVEVPGFQEMIAMAKQLHPRLAEIPIIGWDFIVDKDEKVNLIECNLHWAGIVKYQECNGPLFGDNTEEILNGLLKK